MQRHLYFWLGLFCAIVLGIPISIGVMGVAEEAALNWVAFAFGVGASLIAVALTFAFFRRRIFKKLFGTVESSLDGVVSSFAQAIASGAAGRPDEAAIAAGEASRGILAWYTWTSLYRWVIATCIAILVALAGFAGTVLLFEQNRKLSDQTEQFTRQNEMLAIQTELVGLNLTTRVRVLLESPGTVSGIPELQKDWNNSDFSDSEAGQPVDIDLGLTMEEANSLESVCLMSYRNSSTNSLPLRSKLDEVVQLASRKELRERIVNALSAIVSDGNATSFAALILLTELNAKLPAHQFEFEHLDLRGEYTITSDEELEIEIFESVVEDIECPSCQVSVSESYLIGAPPVGSYIETSIALEGLVADHSGEILVSTHSVEAIFGNEFGQSLGDEGAELVAIDYPKSTYLIVSDGLPVESCDEIDEIKELCVDNPFIQCAERAVDKDFRTSML